MEILLQFGSDVEAQNADGNAALVIASRYGTTRLWRFSLSLVPMLRLNPKVEELPCIGLPETGTT